MKNKNRNTFLGIIIEFIAHLLFILFVVAVVSILSFLGINELLKKEEPSQQINETLRHPIKKTKGTINKFFKPIF